MSNVVLHNKSNKNIARASKISDSYVILFIFFISTITTIYACNKVNHDSLWSSFDIPFSSLNWSSSDCYNWEGITCDMAGRVTHLLLPSKRLQGGISISLRNLTKLSHLNLSHNSFSGSLVPELFLSLNHLEILDLSYNLLTGELPMSVPFSYIRVVFIQQLNQRHNYIFIPPACLEFEQCKCQQQLLDRSNIPSSICLHSSLVRLLDSLPMDSME
ncbi:putative non-specific serine/threonine protein kinase [Rosa chinensis]|uniref:Putative non-specific serine/threonine protein kinase n=1 Tax=Rosa chinensis TaxID=74649 RepID=A0A2P6QMS3_ROSCH|nr:putative non-specific serine/threonine protein kinase [Rosa chinensis]